MTRKSWVHLSIIMVFIIGPAAGLHAATYQYHALPLIDNSTYSGYAYGVNNSGVAVGWSYAGANNYVHAAKWTSLTTAVDLGTLSGNAEGSRAEARAINNAGAISGWSNFTTGYNRAFSVPVGGAMTNLGTLGGDRSEAYAINTGGTIAGWSVNNSGNSHAATYAGGWTDLGALDSWPNWGYGYGINDAGVVATKSGSGLAQSVAATFDGAWHNLGTMYPNNGGHSGAYDINNSGWVVGWTSHETRGAVPFLWKAGVGFKDIGLGGYCGTSNAGARAINDLGMAVGYSVTPAGLGNAFLYQDDTGVTVDLNNAAVVAGIPVGVTLNEALGISENGNYIVGYDNWGRPFMLAPVPVPGGLLLLGSGLLGLAVGARRRGRKVYPVNTSRPDAKAQGHKDIGWAMPTLFFRMDSRS